MPLRLTWFVVMLCLLLPGAGVFQEPAVRGPFARRGLFEDDGNALPTLPTFDVCVQQPQK